MRIRHRILLMLAACWLLSMGHDLFATTWQEMRVTDFDSYKGYVTIYGTRIIWADNRNHGGNTYDIYCYDLLSQTEFPLFVHPATQIKPEIFGDRVVFEDYRDKPWPSHGNVNIYMYEFGTGAVTQITSDPSWQYTPSIYKKKIFWHDGRNDQLDIYGYDLDTAVEFPVSTYPDAYKLYASSYENIVVWQDQRNGFPDIYAYDLDLLNEFPISVRPGSQTLPRIFGSVVVWQDNRDFTTTGLDVMAYDLEQEEEAEFAVSSEEGNQSRPDIYGDLVVWEHSEGGSEDIHGLDVRTG